MKLKSFLIILIIIGGIFIITADTAEDKSLVRNSFQKINGVSLVAPSQKIESHALNSITRINANWIAIIPFAYTPRNSSRVKYYEKHPNWWGEGVEGTIAQILFAKEKGLKVLVKPHVWVIGQGWPGEFNLENEEEWKEWELDYRQYLLRYAVVCDSLNVDMMCVGTEYRIAVRERPEFWISLIDKVRKVYSGPLTYAANWDNYKKVTFWDKLDYVGIDAYFPLSEVSSPNIDQLSEAWNVKANEIKEFSEMVERKVLFTEFGYRSCEGATGAHWEITKEDHVNMEIQKIAYQALFNQTWNEDWMAGGFLWKWFSNDANAGGKSDRHYTPQNKPAEEVISKYYSSR